VLWLEALLGFFADLRMIFTDIEERLVFSDSEEMMVFSDSEDVDDDL